MSFTENHQSSSSDGLKIPGLVRSQDSVEQLSFTSSSATPFPARAALLSDPESSPDLSDRDTMRQVAAMPDLISPPTPTPEAGSTRELLLQSQPAITRALTNTLSNGNTTSFRAPVVIRGGGKKTSVRPPQGRRHVIGIAAIVLLLVITVGTLFAVSPMGHEANMHLNPFSGSSGSLVDGGGNGNLRLVAQQATATAVVHQQVDGFDPNSGGGAPAISSSIAGSESWPLGVCTYWANLDYHNLTGYWVNWTGNAYQWAYGASMAGWVVSSTPKVYSIMVLQPGVQGASGFGHVAVVTGISGNIVHTSNMNWYAGGGWDIVSEYDFTVGPGVSFIWHR